MVRIYIVSKYKVIAGIAGYGRCRTLWRYGSVMYRKTIIDKVQAIIQQAIQ